MWGVPAGRLACLGAATQIAPTGSAEHAIKQQHRGALLLSGGLNRTERQPLHVHSYGGAFSAPNVWSNDHRRSDLVSDPTDGGRRIVAAIIGEDAPAFVARASDKSGPLLPARQRARANAPVARVNLKCADSQSAHRASPVPPYNAGRRTRSLHRGMASRAEVTSLSSEHGGIGRRHRGPRMPPHCSQAFRARLSRWQQQRRFSPSPPPLHPAAAGRSRVGSANTRIFVSMSRRRYYCFFADAQPIARAVQVTLFPHHGTRR